MLAKWTEILPLFVIKWLARRSCERVAYGMQEFVTARPDVLIKL